MEIIGREKHVSGPSQKTHGHYMKYVHHERTVMRAERQTTVFLKFIFVALLTMPIVLAGDSPLLTLTVVDETQVDVFDSQGKLLQSLPRGGEPPTEDNHDYFTFIEDMNFDGYPDIGILFSQGLRNIYYDCWLWQPDAKKFVKYEDMSDMANLGFIPGVKKVYSYTHVSAAFNGKTEYVWENGRLAAVSQDIQEYSDDGKTIIVRRYDRDAGGKLRLTSESILPPEEVERIHGREREDADRESETDASGLQK